MSRRKAKLVEMALSGDLAACQCTIAGRAGRKWRLCHRRAIWEFRLRREHLATIKRCTQHTFCLSLMQIYDFRLLGATEWVGWPFDEETAIKKKLTALAKEAR